MLVKERMTRRPILVAPDVSISEALNLMKREKVRWLPVVDKTGHLVGIVSDKDLLHASPSPATSLSVWEITYLLGKITVADVMTKQVITVTEDTPVEDAARIMADNKIGGLPVVKDGNVLDFGHFGQKWLFSAILRACVFHIWRFWYEQSTKCGGVCKIGQSPVT